MDHLGLVSLKEWTDLMYVGTVGVITLLASAYQECRQYPGQKCVHRYGVTLTKNGETILQRNAIIGLGS